MKPQVLLIGVRRIRILEWDGVGRCMEVDFLAARHGASHWKTSSCSLIVYKGLRERETSPFRRRMR